MCIRYTFHSVSIAEGVEGVFAGGCCRGDVGYHDCACLVACKGVSEHLTNHAHTSYVSIWLTFVRVGNAWHAITKYA